MIFIVQLIVFLLVFAGVFVGGLWVLEYYGELPNWVCKNPKISWEKKAGIRDDR